MGTIEGIGVGQNEDNSLIAIGFLIYGPVMLIGVHALDLVPKKAAGTAAGLTGLFGYVGGTTIANAGVGFVVDLYGWAGGFIMLLISCVLAIIFLALTWSPGIIRDRCNPKNHTINLCNYFSG